HRTLEAADIGGDTRLVHLLDLADAHLDFGLAVAQHGFECGTPHALDAAGLIDIVDGHRRADARLLAAVGDEAGHGMDEADLYRLSLRTQHRWEAERAHRNAAGDEMSTANAAPAKFPLHHCGSPLRSCGGLTSKR